MTVNNVLANKSWKASKINELEAGDILLFRPNMKVLMSQVGIMIYQSFFHRKGGHFDTVHVTVCSGKNAAGQATIAHTAIVPGIANDYYHEPIQDMLTREGGDRAFIAYRPKNKAFAEEVGQIAAMEKRHLTWSMACAMTTALPSLNHANDSVNAITTNTFCSRFAIEVMKLAAKKIGGVVMNLCPRSTPKSLESYLEKSAEFEKFCYLGLHPYQRLETEIRIQLHRLSLQTHQAGQEKFTATFAAFKQAKKHIRINAIQNDTDRIQILLQTVLPEFAINSNWNITPTSYKKITKLARSMGVFKKNIAVANESVIAPNVSGFCKRA